MMMPRKKRKMLIIMLIMFLIIAIISILAVLYITTDAFKSNSTLFAKYITQNFESLGNIYAEFTENDYNELLKNNKYISDIEVKVNKTENTGTTLENANNNISMLKLKVEGQVDINNNYNYQNFKLLKNNEQVSDVRIIQDNEICGVQLADIFTQYVVANKENLKELFEELGYSSEQISRIPDKVDINSNFMDDFKFSEEEMQTIAGKYTNIIISNISKNNFSKLSNQQIQIGEKNITANAYVLTLTKEQLNNIYINLLNELKQDEIIISKLEKLQETIKQYQTIFGKTEEDITELYTEEIQYLVDDITRSNIGQDLYTISVYESNNVTKKIEVKGAEYVYSIGIITSQEEGQYLEITYNENVQNNENGNTFVYKKKDDNIEMIFKNIIDGVESEYTIINNETINGNACKKNTVMRYEDDDNKIEVLIDTNLNVVQSFENPLTLDEENSVNLNDLEIEESKAIVDRVITSVNEKYNDIRENVVDVNDLVKLLVTAKLMKENQYIQSTVEITETEKNRFNSKFEILNGENLNKEDVLNLLNAVKENLVNLEVVSGSELKLILDRFENDEEIFEEIKSFIEDNNNTQYNATVEYDDETGLVSDILLTIVEKQ